jgi:rare lipoprotein A
VTGRWARWTGLLGLGVAACRAHPSTTPDRPPLAADAGPPVLATLTGQATFYHDGLAGRPTASGEPYDPHDLTAAHRTLPFGTIVRVTPAAGGPAVTVRVNDRGPFGDDQRIIDLSRAAAEQLGMIRAGVIRVRVEVVRIGDSRRP